MKRSELIKYTNKLLNIYDYQDYGPNGLQIEGNEDISKLAFAVSATKYSIDKAVELGADILIVHHGLFWKFHGVRTLTKAFYKRVAPLIKNDINLVGYHLPLDAHIEIGNAAALARKLGLSELKPFGDHKGMPTGVHGVFKNPLSIDEFKNTLQATLDHKIIHATGDSEKISSLGIITGGANSDWVHAQRLGLDAYLTGEISEHDWHEASEGGVHFFAGGHNATEQFGIQELMKNIHEKFGGDTHEYFFIPSDNPA